MDLCSFQHEEICYESRNCPLCEANNTIEELKEQVKNLEKEIENLKEA